MYLRGRREDEVEVELLSIALKARATLGHCKSKFRGRLSDVGVFQEVLTRLAQDQEPGGG